MGECPTSVLGRGFYLSPPHVSVGEGAGGGALNKKARPKADTASRAPVVSPIEAPLADPRRDRPGDGHRRRHTEVRERHRGCAADPPGRCRVELDDLALATSRRAPRSE